jgi:hypothetical protein
MFVVVVFYYVQLLSEETTFFLTFLVPFFWDSQNFKMPNFPKYRMPYKNTIKKQQPNNFSSG